MSENNERFTVESLGYKQELKRALSTTDLIIYGLIFMVPIAPFGIFGVVADISKGMVALAYLIGMSGMIFTAFSYWRMSEVFPISGSVYGYTTHALNKNIGFLSGWAILLDYVLVPALLYVVSAAALKSIIPAIPAWVWIVGFILINTAINIRGIEFTAGFNRIVLVLELIVFLIFVGAAINALAHGAGEGFTWKPLFNPENFSMTMVMGAVSVAVLSFLGFDGISTLAEESKGGISAVGKASVASLLIVGVLFITQTFLAALVAPWPNVEVYGNLDDAFYQVANLAGGAWLMWTCAIATGLAWGIANSLAAQAAISRIIFSMARDGFLPKALSKVHPKYQTPYISTLFIAILSLVITLAFTNSIEALSTLINFGALTAFLVLNFTVIYYFMIKRKSKKYFLHLVLPLIGFAIIAFVWLNLNSTAKLLGISWIALGIVVLLIITKVLKRNMDLEV